MTHDRVMIIAPHPDDESLACAGVILRTKRAGGSVRVVFLTNGDGFAKAAALNSSKDIGALVPEDFMAMARSRQGSAVKACRLLGLSPQDGVFLGYPNGGLSRMMSAPEEEVFTQPCTGKSGTYALMAPDYHSQAHGKPAPYTRSAARGDVGELIKDFAPGEIYVTDAADGHGDHRAAFGLARDAASAAGFRGKLYTYLVHVATGTWPWPRGATPDSPFEFHEEDGKPVPSGLAWPPNDRRPMTREEAALKLAAIQSYTLEMELAKDYIESFVKSEEIFWLPEAEGQSDRSRRRD